MDLKNPWAWRKAFRWAGSALAGCTILVTLPTWWATTYANAAVANGACAGVKGCELAYFCPSEAMGWLPHAALCMQGTFVPQEVDAASWRDGMYAALPSALTPFLPDTLTIRWLGEPVRGWR